MPYATGYRLQFVNVESKTVVVDIYDEETWSDDLAVRTTYTALTPAGTPLRISTVDNDEDKYSPVKGKQAAVTFLSTNQTKLNTFLGGNDDRWYTEIYLADDLGEPEFYLLKGYVIVDDISQDFLDDSTSCEVMLTVTDGLGLLKEVPLVNTSDTNPTGYNKIITYIAWCLAKTNLDLDIYVANNIMGEDTPGDILYDSHYLQAKTFEDRIGESEDSYTVLEKILGFDSFITQYNGAWWIMRIDEIDHNLIYTNVFDSTGVNQDTPASSTYNMSIGDGLSICFSQQSTLVKGVRAYKNVTLEYPYNLPEEIVDNIDFSRGALAVPISSTDKRYMLDDWTIKRSTYNGGQTGQTFWNNWVTPEVLDVKIRRIFEDDYEKQRYVIFGQPTVDYHFIESNPIPVNRGDKFSLSADFMLDSNISGGVDYEYQVYLLLYGDDGNVYSYLDWELVAAGSEDAEWRTVLVSSETMLDDRGGAVIYDSSGNVTGAATEYGFPVDGDLYIYIPFGQTGGVSNPLRYKYLQNLRFEYIPKINGSYAKYRAQHTKVSQTGELRAKVDEDVFISDSPKKLFKGALFKNGTWTLTDETTVKFGPGNAIQIAGANPADYPAGAFVKFIGITVNTNPFRIVSSSEAGGIVTLNVLQAVTDESAAGFNNHAVYKFVSGTYTLADGFYAGNVFPSGLPDVEYIHPYGHIQAYSVWNQYNRVMRVYDGNMQGLQTDTVNPPDMIHKFSVSAVSPHATNKNFILLHYDMDFKSCEWTGTFAEVYDTVIGKTYADTKEFKYISDKTV